jgi:hypothetical protein
MPIEDEEDDIEVQPCPDLHDHRFVGGVRLLLPGGAVVDLSAKRAARVAETIISVLYQTGRLKPTV